LRESTVLPIKRTTRKRPAGYRRRGEKGKGEVAFFLAERRKRGARYLPLWRDRLREKKGGFQSSRSRKRRKKRTILFPLWDIGPTPLQPMGIGSKREKRGKPSVGRLIGLREGGGEV